MSDPREARYKRREFVSVAVGALGGAAVGALLVGLRGILPAPTKTIPIVSNTLPISTETPPIVDDVNERLTDNLIKYGAQPISEFDFRGEIKFKTFALPDNPFDQSSAHLFVQMIVPSQPPDQEQQRGILLSVPKTIYDKAHAGATMDMSQPLQALPLIERKLILQLGPGYQVALPIGQGPNHSLSLGAPPDREISALRVYHASERPKYNLYTTQIATADVIRVGGLGITKAIAHDTSVFYILPANNPLMPGMDIYPLPDEPESGIQREAEALILSGIEGYNQEKVALVNLARIAPTQGPLPPTSLLTTRGNFPINPNGKFTSDEIAKILEYMGLKPADQKGYTRYLRETIGTDGNVLPTYDPVQNRVHHAVYMSPGANTGFQERFTLTSR